MCVRVCVRVCGCAGGGDDAVPAPRTTIIVYKVKSCFVSCVELPAAIGIESGLTKSVDNRVP